MLRKRLGSLMGSDGAGELGLAAGDGIRVLDDTEYRPLALCE